MRRRFVVEYRKQHRFARPREEVWAAIADLDRFERRWGWLGQFRVEGDGLATGSVLHGTVDPPMPYRMRVAVAIDACTPTERVDATVSGDLIGQAAIRLHELPGGRTTIVTADWTVEVMQRSMRLAALCAHPLLRWGHDRVVDSTVNAFRAELLRN